MTAWLLDGRGVVVPAAIAAAAVALLSSWQPLIAVAALAAAILLILVISKPEAVLLLLVATLPWEGVLGYPTQSVTVVKLLGLLLFGAYLLRAVGSETKLRVPPTAYAVGAFVLMICVSLIFSPDAGAGTGKLLRYLLFAAFFFIVVQIVDDEPGLLRVVRVMVFSVTVAAVAGLIPFLAGQATRATGPITDPNDFGYLMAATLPLAGYLVLRDRRWRPLWGVCFPLILAGMLATLSRGMAVSLGVLLLWGVLTGRIRLGGLIASVAAVIAVIAVGFALWSPIINEHVQEKGQIAGENVSSREALWRGALAMSMDHPLVGVGPGRFGAESVVYVHDNPVILQDPVTHDTYLEILAENGFFALLAFVAFLVGSWLSLAGASRAARAEGDREGRRLASALQASLLVAAVGALFLSEQLATPFWLIGALAAATPGILAGRRSPSSQHL